jgi:hypothetical protein
MKRIQNLNSLSNAVNRGNTIEPAEANALNKVTVNSGIRITPLNNSYGLGMNAPFGSLDINPEHG